MSFNTYVQISKLTKSGGTPPLPNPAAFDKAAVTTAVATAALLSTNAVQGSQNGSSKLNSQNTLSQPLNMPNLASTTSIVTQNIEAGGPPPPATATANSTTNPKVPPQYQPNFLQPTFTTGVLPTPRGITVATPKTAAAVVGSLVSKFDSKVPLPAMNNSVTRNGGVVVPGKNRLVDILCSPKLGFRGGPVKVPAASKSSSGGPGSGQNITNNLSASTGGNSTGHINVNVNLQHNAEGRVNNNHADNLGHSMRSYGSATSLKSICLFRILY